MHRNDEQREALDRRALLELQERRLVELMAVLAHNPFYRKKLAGSGIDPQTIRRRQQLAELPFTHKTELLESQRLHPPYGELLSYPLSRYRYLHQTSGTSGEPLLWLDTEEDWQCWRRCWVEVYREPVPGPGDPAGLLGRLSNEAVARRRPTDGW